MRRFNKFALALVLGLGTDSATALIAPSAHAQMGVVDVKAIAQAIKSNANQAMMIQRQLQQYQNLLLNSTGLPMQEWGETMQAINSVNNVMRQSQSLSFQSSTLQQQLLNKFKGYGTYNSGSISDQKSTSLNSSNSC